MSEQPSADTSTTNTLEPTAETVIQDAPTDDDARILESMARVRDGYTKDEKKEPAEKTEPAPDKSDPGDKEEDAEHPEQPAAAKSLGERLRERLEARKEKAKAKQDYTSLKSDLEAQQRSFYEQAKQMQAEFYHRQQQFEQERQQWLRDVASNPIKLVTDYGHSAEDIIRNIQLSDDPTYQATIKAQTELQQLKAQVERDRQERELRAKEEQQRFAEYQQRQQQELHQRGVHEVLNVLATEQSTPALRALYTDRQILADVNDVIEQYMEKTGQPCTLPEAVEYLEQRASQRLDALRGKAAEQPAKSRGNGQRTLTGKTASERLATPRSNKDLSDEDMDQVILAKMAATRAGRTA